MVRFKIFWGVIAAGLIAAIAYPSPTGAATKARVAANYGKLPLIFEANRGQTDGRVKFLSRGPGYTLFLTPGEAVLSLRGTDGKGHALRVKLLGAEAEPKMTGLARLPGVSNYFIGRDRSKWQTGVPHFAKVGYEGVYPGIDLVFYGANWSTTSSSPRAPIRPASGSPSKAPSAWKSQSPAISSPTFPAARCGSRSR